MEHHCLSSPGLFRCTVHQHYSPALMLPVYVYVKQNSISFQVCYHKCESPLAAKSIHRDCKDVYYFSFFSTFWNTVGVTKCDSSGIADYHRTAVVVPSNRWRFKKVIMSISLAVTHATMVIWVCLRDNLQVLSSSGWINTALVKQLLNFRWFSVEWRIFVHTEQQRMGGCSF